MPNFGQKQPNYFERFCVRVNLTNVGESSLALSEEECGALLSKIRYKTVSLQLVQYGDGVYLSCRFPVVCARRGTHTSIDVKHRLPKRKFKDGEQFVLWVYKKMVWFEIHEAREWFLFGGRRVLNPHSKKKLTFGAA